MMFRNKFSVKLYFFVGLIYGAFLFTLGSCDSPNETASLVENQGNLVKARRSVSDMAGRTVEIPLEIRTVYCAVPTAEALVYSLAPEKMAAWVNSPGDEVLKFLKPAMANLPVLGGWMGEKTTANLEEIARLRPDLIIFMTSTGINNNGTEIAQSITDQTKVPVLVMDSSFAATPQVYRLMGEILGVQERAETLARYCEEKMETLKAKLAAIPDEALKSVYYAEGSGGLATDPSGSSHTEVLDFVRGINVAQIEARGGMGMSKVSMEQIMTWNPSVILVSSSSGGEKTFQEIKEDSSWAKLEALKTNQLFITPAYPFGWFDRPPNIMRILGIQWLGNLLYPDYVDLDLGTEIKDFFKVFMELDLDDSQVAELLANAR